jgi:predicted nucleotidyltransferase
MFTNIEATVCTVLQQYPIKKAALFGSAARGDLTDKSDIDIVVEFLPGRGGVNLEFFGLRIDLEEALGCQVDLLTYDALINEAKPKFRDNVMRDERIIYER